MPTYNQTIGARYHIYNSLFLQLPYQNIFRTGTLLPLLQQHCETGFEEGKSATEILNQFFQDFTPGTNQSEQFDLLFNFIQYIERQVALFDSIEDSAFEQINDLSGKGTIASLLLHAKFEHKEELLAKHLEEFSLRPVLTAHPTQFYPGHVLGILTDLEKSIRSNELGHINLLLQQLGKTGFINDTKPTPYDEAITLCWYLENVFYHAIPEIIEKFAAGLDIPISEWKNNRLMVIGFWPGGDRDGNPFVTSEITLKVAALLQESILKCYYRDVRILRRRLTFRGVDKNMIDIEQKIYNWVFGTKKGYDHIDEFLTDLHAARKFLVDDHGGLFLDLLDSFILKVKQFGFYFASLDIRQDSRKHDYVWTQILNELSKNGQSISGDDFLKLPIQDQIPYLLSLNVSLGDLHIEDELVNETINSIKAIAAIQKSNGKTGSHRYVISNCQSALHIIEVFALARLLNATQDGLELDVVPLFETIDDLSASENIMQTLYAAPIYAAHLKARNQEQPIMLGFSDGT